MENIDIITGINSEGRARCRIRGGEGGDTKAHLRARVLSLSFFSRS